MFIIFVPPFLPRTNAWQPLLKRKNAPYNQIQCQRMSNRRTNQTDIKKRKRSKNIFSTHFFFLLDGAKRRSTRAQAKKKAPLRLEVTFRQHAENSARKAEDRSGEKLDYRETLARLCHNAMTTHTHLPCLPFATNPMPNVSLSTFHRFPGWSVWTVCCMLSGKASLRCKTMDWVMGKKNRSDHGGPRHHPAFATRHSEGFARMQRAFSFAFFCFFFFSARLMCSSIAYTCAPGSRFLDRLIGTAVPVRAGLAHPLTAHRWEKFQL